MPSRPTQFLLAALMVAALFAATMYVWNRDETRFFDMAGLAPAKKETVVLVSRVDGDEQTIITNDPISTRYKHVPQSVNQGGGTEVSYSFIIKGRSSFTVFRGDEKSNENGEYCPRIHVSDGHVEVSFSTVDYSKETPESTKQTVTFEDAIGDRPTHVCVAIRDTNPGVRDLGFRDKIRVDLFLNGKRRETKYVGTDCRVEGWTPESARVCRSQLVPNRGKISFRSDTAVVESLRYHNWFLGEAEAREQFEQARETSSFASDEF